MVNVIMWSLVVSFFLGIFASVINYLISLRLASGLYATSVLPAVELRWNRAAGQFYRTCFHCDATLVVSA